MPNRTRAVNIKDEACDQYIGRGTKGNIPMLPGERGYFGNPVRIGKPCPVCGGRHDNAGSTLPCYRKYLRLRLRFDHLFRREFETLRGKRLGCFCKPGPCHGDVIAEFLDD